MPREVHELAERLKAHPGVKDPWALATALVKRRERAKVAREVQQREKEQTGE